MVRTVSRQLAAMGRPAFGSLAFWTYPAWGTSPYWESIPYGESGPSPVHAHAGPPSR
jgi:hypothetical protein